MLIFWLSPLLNLIFSVNLKILSVVGLGSWKHIILPAFILKFGLAAITTQMNRTSVIEVLNQDYIRTARAKGLYEIQVVVIHALKYTIIPFYYHR